MTRRSAFPTAPLLALVTWLLALPVGAQSAWTQPEGASFLQVSLSRIGPYDKLFQSSGPSFNTGREITETSLELYGEYGLTEAWTLVGNVPVRSVDSGSIVPNATIQPVTIESDTLTSLGNILVGVRRRLGTGTVSMAGQLDLELPTGSSDASSGLSTGLDAFTLRPWFSVGRGFGRAYAQAHVGVSLRTDDYSNDARLGAEVGYQFTKALLIAGTVDLVDSFKNGSVELDPRRLQTGLFVDEQEYLSAGVKGLYQLTDEFGLAGAIRGAFSGNNVPEAPYVTLGVTFRH